MLESSVLRVRVWVGGKCVCVLMGSVCVCVLVGSVCVCVLVGSVCVFTYLNEHISVRQFVQFKTI